MNQIFLFLVLNIYLTVLLVFVYGMNIYRYQNGGAILECKLNITITCSNNEVNIKKK